MIKSAKSSRVTFDPDTIDNDSSVYMDSLGMDWAKEGLCRICEDKTQFRCKFCPWIFYCCKEHQSADWPTHKILCNKITAREDADFGRVKVSKSKLEANTLVMKKPTIVLLPRLPFLEEWQPSASDRDPESSKHIPVICLGCYGMIDKKLSELFCCGRCLWPLHNQNCGQKTPHLAECNIFRANQVLWDPQNKYIYDLVGVLRACLIKTAFQYQWKMLMRMPNRYQNRVETEFDKMALVFIQQICHLTFVTPTDIKDAIGVLMTNRIIIPSNEDPPIKRYVYFLLQAEDRLPMSPFPHSCEPNIRTVINNKLQVEFHTSQRIPRGQMLTMNLIPEEMCATLRSRQQFLAYFNRPYCFCSRCVEEIGLNLPSNYLFAIKCTGCKRSFLTPNESRELWICTGGHQPSCKVQLPAEQVETNIFSKIAGDIEEEIYKVADTETNLIDLWTILYFRYAGIILHPKHYLMHTISVKICELTSSIILDEEKYHLGHHPYEDNILLLENFARTVSVLEQIYPGTSYKKGKYMTCHGLLRLKHLELSISNESMTVDEANDDLEEIFRGLNLGIEMMLENFKRDPEDDDLTEEEVENVHKKMCLVKLSFMTHLLKAFFEADIDKALKLEGVIQLQKQVVRYL